MIINNLHQTKVGSVAKRVEKGTLDHFSTHFLGAKVQIIFD